MNTEILMAVLAQRQDQTRKALTEVQATLARVKSKSAEATALRERANAKLGEVALDGSLGVHNLERSTRLIEDARQLAARASRLR
jgi:hypothetical protein